MEKGIYKETLSSQQDVSAPLGSPENPSSKVLTLSNCITVVRLLLTLIFIWLFVSDVHRMGALAIYALAASTDWLDGHIARATRTVTWTGKVLDPVVDRALLFSGIIALVAHGELPLWMAVLLVGRDVYLAGGARILMHYYRKPLDVVFIGKFTTAVLLFGYCLLLLDQPQIAPLKLVDSPYLPWLNHQAASLGIVFVYVGMCTSIITAAIYTRQAYKIIREIQKEAQ